MPSMITRRNFRSYDKDNGQTGIWVPNYSPFAQSTAATNLTASRAYFSKVVPSRNMSIASIKFVLITAAASNDACDVGLFDSGGNRLVSAGATTGKLNSGSNVVVSVSITPTTILAGQTYYAAFSCGTFGGAIAVLVLTNPAGGATSVLGDVPGTAIGSRICGIQASAHPLGTTATLATGSQVPLLFLSET